MRNYIVRIIRELPNVKHPMVSTFFATGTNEMEVLYNASEQFAEPADVITVEEVTNKRFRFISAGFDTTRISEAYKEEQRRKFWADVLDFEP